MINNKIRIGTLTLFHKNYNWGGVLQGYALKYYIEKQYLNAEVDILQYHSGSNIVYKGKLQQALQYSPIEIVKKISGRIKNKKISHPEEFDLSNRKQLFDKFMNGFRTNPRIYNDSSLLVAANEYDCLITGSDQIWNPNVARPGYFLSMVADECKKIAYAASIARNDLSKHEQKIMLPLITHYDYVSVREKTAKSFLDRYLASNKEVTEVLDPAMLLTAEEWSQLCKDENFSHNKKYILAFFFSDSLRYRERLMHYCKEHNLELKYIPFAKGEYMENDLKGPGLPVRDVGPREFISLFKNAEYVFTDSFHGSVFSIIFSKDFCVFERDQNNKVSKNSRLYDLLDKFNLSNRLVRSQEELEDCLQTRIDYNLVARLLEEYRADSRAFLDTALGAVSIEKRGSNFLFAGSDLKTSERCDCFIGYNENDNIRGKSSSGGMFYELATFILKKQGVIYGAAYVHSDLVEHVRVDTFDGLEYLLKSKYVQSSMKNVYGNLKADLTVGRKVLFCGTPCQCDAVYRFIREQKIPSDTLYLVDFICHGVPSPLVFHSYVEYLKKSGEIEFVDFRDKSHGGWHDYYLYKYYKDNSHNGGVSHELDPYMRTFLADNNLRPSCYECLHKDIYYSSDITLGDAWKVEKDKPEWADDKGTSLFIIRSEKGREMLHGMADEFVYSKVDYEKWTRLNPSVVLPTNRPSARDGFFKDFKTMSNTEFWNKYSSMPIKKIIRYKVKRILNKIGLEKTVRKFV